MTHKAAFARLISRPGLKQLAGEKYFQRGRSYFEDGAVVHLQPNESGISARVQGTEPSPYAVRFWIEKQSLKWGCTCPLGSENAFCKHLVAAGLAWLAGDLIEGEGQAGPETLETIRELLEATDEQLLAEVVCLRALWDESLLAELALAARASRHENAAPAERGERNAAPRKRHASRRKPSSSAD
jgi:uncharacterized Zn finger protein